MNTERTYFFAKKRKNGQATSTLIISYPLGDKPKIPTYSKNLHEDNKRKMKRPGKK